ncbi:uncharacterized protein LOC110874779 [Helianthus annuus]|uniref:uncharacterized protein LOC110874778 n=1 Tax=Helianthus annuus TaxID=4232 RepID=UPI000B8F6212|nr:uncharacterized protein LOC110874778 [Helianthus annuus]XP_021978907.1 uncharacterized protein LOC110874779 [Helianthus annuus]
MKCLEHWILRIQVQDLLFSNFILLACLNFVDSGLDSGSGQTQSTPSQHGSTWSVLRYGSAQSVLGFGSTRSTWFRTGSTQVNAVRFDVRVRVNGGQTWSTGRFWCSGQHGQPWSMQSTTIKLGQLKSTSQHETRNTIDAR